MPSTLFLLAEYGWRGELEEVGMYATIKRSCPKCNNPLFVDDDILTCLICAWDSNYTKRPPQEVIDKAGISGSGARHGSNVHNAADNMDKYQRNHDLARGRRVL